MRLQQFAALVVSSALVVALPLYADSASANSTAELREPTAGPHGSQTPRSAASLLAQAETALTGTAAVDARATARPDGRDLTLMLRELSFRRSELSARDRAAADRLLARPTGGATYVGERYRTKSKHYCSKHVCVHWVTKGEDKPPLHDSRDRDRIPEWVETTSRNAEKVWDREVTQAGYRAPRSDRNSKNHGPNRKLDIYLANLGDNGLYGFCTSDDPRGQRGERSVSAYCVIDNDFSRREFRTRPLKALRVTLAHEFFHAVQYSYDWFEDSWLLEGTATWIEDQVFDAINDNRQFLRRNSPHTRPDVPLDVFDGWNYPQYGVWSFFQYLGEKYPAKHGGMPRIVRAIWRYADNSSPSKPGQYSTQAIESVLRARSSSFSDAFAEYGAVNLLPRSFYSEGAAFPASPVIKSCPNPICATTPGEISLDHLTNASAKLLPADGYSTLHVDVDLGDVLRGAAATLTRVPKVGPPIRERITLQPDGRGSLDRPFSSADFAYATVTLTNTSIRYTCWQQSYLACQGASKDDAQGAVVTTSAIP